MNSTFLAVSFSGNLRQLAYFPRSREGYIVTWPSHDAWIPCPPLGGFVERLRHLAAREWNLQDLDGILGGLSRCGWHTSESSVFFFFFLFSINKNVWLLHAWLLHARLTVDITDGNPFGEYFKASYIIYYILFLFLSFLFAQCEISFSPPFSTFSPLLH